MSDSDDLKQQFATLRERDARDTPPFAGTLAAARARRVPRASATWGWGALGGAMAVIAVVSVALNLAGGRRSVPGEAGPLTGVVDQWIAPTDGLLASADLLAPAGTMLGDADDIAFFTSPTADLLEAIAAPTARTP